MHGTCPLHQCAQHWGPYDGRMNQGPGQEWQWAWETLVSPIVSPKTKCLRCVFFVWVTSITQAKRFTQNQWHPLELVEILSY